MMRIDIITALPKLLESPFSDSILKRAIEKNQVVVNIHNLRDYTTYKQKQIDDYQYGGEAGMVLMIEPIANCIRHLQKTCTFDEIIYMSPDGETLNQKIANGFSLKTNLLIICGHYKGIDQRVRDLFVTREISIGDYVLSGGELAAAVFCDAVIRLLPGVLNDASSALTDSFQDNLLAPPVYTRPSIYEGVSVPDILLSGNTKQIEQWKQDMALKITQKKRPDLLG